MKVKICGITNLEDALLCSNLGADALGFIFYEKSKRFISYSQAAEIIRNLPAFIMKVGVFVNEDPEIVNNVASKTGLNAVQLHGEEPPEYLSKINLPVIKAFRVSDNFDWTQLENFSNCNFLLDTYTTTEMGGTGKTFDWNSIPKKYKSKIILSGGITIDKLEYIFKKIKPAAIDLSSSLESSPGKKDHNKVKQFFNEYHLLNTNNL